MGELIAFKPALGGRRVRPAAPLRHGTVVVFTGIWQERPKEAGSETKRTRRSSGKRPKKKIGKRGGKHQEQNGACL